MRVQDEGLLSEMSRESRVRIAEAPPPSWHSLDEADFSVVDQMVRNNYKTAQDIGSVHICSCWVHKPPNHACYYRI